MSNDLIRLAMEQAAQNFGGDSLIFNSAGFAVAFARLAGVNGALDGKYVRAMLTGRSDVEVLSGGAHYRLIETSEDSERERLFKEITDSFSRIIKGASIEKLQAFRDAMVTIERD